MTCIVALRHKGVIYMGADSAGVGGYSLRVRTDPKIYRSGPVLFGFTTSFRMGQLLGHAFSMPTHHRDVPIEKFMATTFIDAVRQCLKNGGYAKKENDVEKGGTFLVAYSKRLFRIDDDYQVGTTRVPFDAVGCGFELALGSLHATHVTGKSIHPKARIRLALRAAECFSAGVRAPFLIEELR